MDGKGIFCNALLNLEIREKKKRLEQAGGGRRGGRIFLSDNFHA